MFHIKRIICLLSFFLILNSYSEQVTLHNNLLEIEKALNIVCNDKNPEWNADLFVVGVYQSAKISKADKIRILCEEDYVFGSKYFGKNDIYIVYVCTKPKKSEIILGGSYVFFVDIKNEKIVEWLGFK